MKNGRICEKQRITVHIAFMQLRNVTALTKWSEYRTFSFKSYFLHTRTPQSDDIMSADGQGS